MIGKVIRGLLDDNAALVALVPVANMFPYVMNENTALPAIVYTIDSLNAVYNKDGWVGDDCTFSVYSFSGNYSTLNSIATQVRAALEEKKGTTESITYERIELSGMMEGYSVSDDTFLNKLTFTITVTDY
jgi:hypothetical protein